MTGASTATSKIILLRLVGHQIKKEEKEEAHNINQINNFIAMLF